jgi:hypothetical protein
MRKHTPKEAETEVLVSSHRRCALCFGLRGDLREKAGQLAHVDRNASNSTTDNLCYVCLDHHDQYDSRRSQSKGYTPSELIHYRSLLYSEIDRFGIRPDSSPKATEPVFLTLNGNSFSAGRLDLILKNDGAPFNILKFEVSTPGANIQQWYPRSLSSGDLLHAPTHLPQGQQSECIFHMKVRDRAGYERVFQILVDTRPSPPAYDFLEVG